MDKVERYHNFIVNNMLEKTIITNDMPKTFVNFPFAVGVGYNVIALMGILRSHYPGVSFEDHVVGVYGAKLSEVKSLWVSYSEGLLELLGDE